MAKDVPAPQLDDRPAGLRVERAMTASPAALYAAFTTGWERWFAAPGSLRTRAEAGEPFFLVVEHAGARHPHYGRFLRLVPDRMVELTWVTGRGGTDGAETVVTVALEPAGAGTRLTLAQQGFYDDQAAGRAEAAWPSVLAHLDARLAG